MIHVIAQIEVVPGQRVAFLEEFHKIVPLVQQEHGCLHYEPTIDTGTGLAAQDAVREDVVTVVEQWKSVAALEAHLQAPHMLEYRQRVKQLVVGASIRVLEPA